MADCRPPAPPPRSRAGRVARAQGVIAIPTSVITIPKRVITMPKSLITISKRPVITMVRYPHKGYALETDDLPEGLS